VIKTYPAEDAAGIADLVRATARVCHASAALAGPRAASLLDAAVAAATDPDLFPIRSVLASTGMNKNDDFFEKGETYAARNSPAHKPFDYEHAFSDVIGHMTDAEVVDAAGRPVAGDPPDAFHVVNSAVLYRHWPDDKARQKRTDQIIAELLDPPETGGWFVSMECRFTGFDYALVPVEGGVPVPAKAKIVERTDATAWMTKHLRAYGGSGTVQGYRVGRVLRGITFSGIGLVRNPANPDSVIFPPAGDPPATGAAEFLSGFPEAAGYGPLSGGSDTHEETHAMAAEVTAETLKAELETTKANLKAATDKLAERETAEAKAAAEKVKTLEVELAAAKDAAKAVEAAKADAETKLAEARKELDAMKAEAAKAAADEKAKGRVAKVKAAWACETDADAEAQASLLAELSDEKFEAAVQAQLKFAAKNKPAEAAAKPPAGETKESNLPKPMGGGSKPVKGSEVLDEATEVEGQDRSTAAAGAGDDLAALQAEMLAWAGLDEKTKAKK
jgi:hypothetical protein